MLAAKLLATSSRHGLNSFLLFVAVVAIITIVIIVVAVIVWWWDIAQLFSHALAAGHAKALAASTRGLEFILVVGRIFLVGRIVVGKAAFNVWLE